jgi:alpha-tubulin suppressor-like RCC1 family protein
MPKLLCFASAMLAVAGGACSDSTGNTEPTTRIELVRAVADSTLPANLLDSVAVRVVSGLQGAPAANVSVDFEVVAGGGSVSAARAQTDAGGVATVAWTAGPAVGRNELRARLTDDPDVSVAVVSKSVAARPAVTSGFRLSCGLNAGGRGFCWGRDTGGQLGNGSSAASPLVPGPVEGGLSFWTIDAGQEHVCAVAADRAAYCWGDGREGRLGTGQTVSASAPVAVAGGMRFTDVSAGTQHTCGLTVTGQAWCWGQGRDGQLGTGDRHSSAVPVAVTGGHTFVSISAGMLHSCGVTGTGSLYCWGDGGWGQLGIGGTGFSSAPVPVQGPAFRAVSAGAGHTCAQAADGAGYCWGLGAAGQVGHAELRLPCAPGLGDGCVLVPGRVAPPPAFSLLQAGPDHTCGLVAGGRAYCWGSGLAGKLGIGLVQGSPTPEAVSGQRAFADIDLGNNHTCAITATYEVFCWGGNEVGQLGTGTTDASLVPVPIAGGRL